MTALGYREYEVALLDNPQLIKEAYANSMQYTSSAEGNDAGAPARVTASNAKWADVKMWAKEKVTMLKEEMEKYLDEVNDGTASAVTPVVGALAISGGLVADDVTGIGVADNILIPVVLAGGVVVTIAVGASQMSGPPQGLYDPTLDKWLNEIKNMDKMEPVPPGGPGKWPWWVKAAVGTGLGMKLYQEYQKFRESLSPTDSGQSQGSELKRKR